MMHGWRSRLQSFCRQNPAWCAVGCGGRPPGDQRHSACAEGRLPLEGLSRPVRPADHHLQSLNRWSRRRIWTDILDALVAKGVLRDSPPRSTPPMVTARRRSPMAVKAGRRRRRSVPHAVGQTHENPCGNRRFWDRRPRHRSAFTPWAERRRCQHGRRTDRCGRVAVRCLSPTRASMTSTPYPQAPESQRLKRLSRHPPAAASRKQSDPA